MYIFKMMLRSILHKKGKRVIRKRRIKMMATFRSGQRENCVYGLLRDRLIMFSLPINSYNQGIIANPENPA